MDRASFGLLCKEIFARQIPPMEAPAEERIDALYGLTQRMLEVNRQMNLTAITEESAVILKHYVDSLTVSDLIPEGAFVMDIGCGAGFPTLPLAIFRPDLRILAVDSTAKRIAYVQETANLLGLSNVTALAARAEELGQSSDYREKADVVTARAVASLPVLAELCLPLVRVGGRFVAMKASKGEDELAAASRAVSLCGGKAAGCREISLLSRDGSGETRLLLTFTKDQKTPACYPRHFSKISKKPLIS
ncbi:MAG: 16S rRNA (guanine(527)-N(7))-methyltransferase RsmG [Clostridia bacterium]|nr:16S rRNA (guanine(527)-N(7))-methyltransferase RsmG [Clostridia bacterium]